MIKIVRSKPPAHIKKALKEMVDRVKKENTAHGLPMVGIQDINPETMNFKPTHFWGLRKWLPQYYGTRCRLIACSKMNTALIEFHDGTNHVTLRMGLRKLANPKFSETVTSNQ